MAMNLHLTVFGAPQPQGSTRAFVPKGHSRPIVTSDNSKLKPFRQEVAQTALVAMREAGLQKIPRKLPVAMEVTFYFEKPRAERKSAHWKIARPDLDKLLRACLDSLTGIAYEDDSQVCWAAMQKIFGSPARVEVQVRTIESAAKVSPEVTLRLFDLTDRPGIESRERLGVLRSR